jgi:hypothetical protein
MIASGVFTSVTELKRKLMWKYFDPTRLITPDSTVTGHQAHRRQAMRFRPF